VTVVPLWREHSATVPSLHAPFLPRERQRDAGETVSDGETRIDGRKLTDRGEVTCPQLSVSPSFLLVMPELTGGGSIQKLEELNVGMENLGEEVKSLTQQCNGNGNTPASEDNNNPPSVTPEQNRSRGGGVVSSTPQRSVGG
ncbi:hypothetical protein GOODEAATRI_030468, partial [Goodea atripinnis]